MGDYPAETAKFLKHLPAIAGIARRIAVAAGDAIMEHYSEIGYQGEVREKPDGSPVTLADLAADDLIRAALTDHFPGIPMVTEETFDRIDRAALADHPHFWLVDGLDGTKSFRRGAKEFTVNIALIENDAPVLGVVYAPALGEGFSGTVSGDDRAAIRWNDESEKDHDLRVRRIPPEGVTLLTSTTPDSGPSQRLQTLIDSMKIARHLRRNSSIKFCDVAAARADIYTRLRANSFWDTAAGDAILRAAGGTVTDLMGAPLRYDRNSIPFTNSGFIACNDPDYFLPVFADLFERKILP
jgi:3'(2'), 5'-bisphosphate nucleotidase